MSNESKELQYVDYDLAQSLKTAIANACVKSCVYDWSDEFKLKEIQNKMNDLRNQVYFVPFQNYTLDQLFALGFRKWDEDLYLIPLWLYKFIPHGIELESINGKKIIVGKEYQDKDSNDHIDADIRFGCIAYGIKVEVGSES